MTRLMVLFALLLSQTACDVTQEEVGDAPPKFAHLKKLSGSTYGHIVLTDKAVKEIGANFSGFVYPKTNVLNEKDFHKFIQRIRRVGSYLDPVTETQVQGSSIFDKYAAACEIKRDEFVPETDPFEDCGQILTLEPYKTSYQNCGLLVPEPDQAITQDDVDEKKCKCLSENGKKLAAAEKALNVNIQQLTLLALKQNLGRCAWKMADPPELKKSKRWLYGDDKTEDYEEDPLGAMGSRLSLTQAEDGTVRVQVDLINFNGINYTTESYGFGKWERIRVARYDMGKHKLYIEFNEVKTYGQATGRVITFDLDRMSVMKSVPDFHRFTGELKIHRRNVETGDLNEVVAKGSAKIDGIIMQTEPHMPTVWDEEGVEIPE